MHTMQQMIVGFIGSDLTFEMESQSKSNMPEAALRNLLINYEREYTHL